MIATISEMLSYPFFVRALVVGCAVALCASLLGVSLVLKQYSMIGDGLSHVGFGALSLAIPLNIAPLKISLPIVTVAAFLLLRLKEESRVKADAAMALLSTGALAFGVLTLSMTTGMNTDVCNYLFGSILSMNKTDVKLSLILSATVITVFIVFYNRLFAITFDEKFAAASGVNVKFYNTVISVLTAMVIVLGMRMMGALLMSGLIVIPAITSMALFKKYRSVIIGSAIISVICFLLGMYLSYVYSTPTGAGIVACNFFFLAVAKLLEKIKGGKKHV